eukprot:Lithocolla_globosa_v1_NODE_5594_length_1214_cov_8.691113.p2 type:complete len:128 gc:universal NODE_5594_length_1214_cov_8.691113:66-449(+)
MNQANNIELPTESFSLQKLKLIWDESFIINDRKVTLDNTKLELCKEYIKKYFYPMNNGFHSFFDTNLKSFTTYTKEELCNIYLNRFPFDNKVSLKSWYLKNPEIVICYNHFDVCIIQQFMRKMVCGI